jgi:hypothetical protein
LSASFAERHGGGVAIVWRLPIFDLAGGDADNGFRKLVRIARALFALRTFGHLIQPRQNFAVLIGKHTSIARQKPMANDPPTNQRMGFGFQQARAAGAPYVPPGSPSSYNYEVAERQAAKELRELIEQNPALGRRVQEIIKNAKPIDCGAYKLIICTARTVLWQIKHEIELSKKEAA